MGDANRIWDSVPTIDGLEPCGDQAHWVRLEVEHDGKWRRVGEEEVDVTGWMTMHAYANPNDDNFKATGYGLVRFNKPTREITMECWPRFVDVTQPGAQEYPGWPITVHQEDNYSRKPMEWLPQLEIKGAEDPVVQVIDQLSGEIVYTLRINGNTWRPKVFQAGIYTVKVGEGRDVKVFEDVVSATEQDDRNILVEIEPI